LAEKNKRNMVVPAVVSSAVVMALAAGAVIYHSEQSRTEPPAAEYPPVTSSEAVSETETAVSETSASVSETEADSEEHPAPLLVNRVSGMFGRVNTSKGVLNIRRKPSSSSDIDGSLEKGSVVYISDCEDGWYQIESHEGKTGYVSSDYVILSDYTGSWPEKYLQIATDIQEYFGDEKSSGNLDFYLKALDSDSIPELFYSFSSHDSDGPRFFQIFSAGENELYVDRRRAGSIDEKGYNLTTRELFVKRSFNGEYNTAVLYRDNDVSEKSFCHLSLGQDKTDLYMVDYEKVSPDEYQQQFDEHCGTDAPDKMDFSTLSEKLKSSSVKSDHGIQEKIIFHSPENTDESSVGFSDTSFSHFFGMMVSESSQIPVYKDAAGRKISSYELSGTIVQVTGEEKNMYRILWNSEDSSSAKELFTEKKYIRFNRKTSSWSDKYDELIRFRENSAGDTGKNRYSLEDMNYDGVPELICASSPSGSDRKTLSVYSVYDGQLVSWTYSSECSEFLFYPYSDCLCIKSGDKDKTFSFISFSRGEFKADATFTSHRISGEEYEYTIDGDVVSDEEYSEKFLQYTGEEEPEESDSTNLSPSEILNAIAEY